MTKNYSQTLLDELKVQLEEKKTDLENELKLLNEEDSYKDLSRTVGNAEDADEAYEDSSHLENELKQNTAKATLGLVEKALARMERGTYGKCEVGKEYIDEDRLKAMPEAENCLAHERADEAVETAEEFLEDQEK